MGFIDILDGHIKELFGANENLSNKDGKDVVNYGKEGYVKGCGCNLSKKVRLSNAKCIIRKW